MEPRFVPTGDLLDAEVEGLLTDDGDGDPAAMFRSRDDAAREKASDSIDAQILAGLVYP